MLFFTWNPLTKSYPVGASKLFGEGIKRGAWLRGICQAIITAHKKSHELRHGFFVQY
jgi:hypothetical protein